LLLLGLFGLLSGSQSVPSSGNPFEQNFTKSQYRAVNQNWSIAQGRVGIIYAANNNGLVAYDGAYWTLYHLDNKSFARSVAVAPDGKIYVGGKEEFGYYEQTGTGLRYRKLSHLVDPDILENDEIWKILDR